MLKALNENNYKVNLWEHAYVHPTSPLWEPLKDHSGDFLVWGGLVPDFALPETRKRFADYHKQLMREGISGFKLDECDNSDISVGNSTWGFPEMSTFPSGMDGEQMHQALGLLYLRTLNDMYESENRRTFQDYRSSGLFASSVPASLYSDIYGYKDALYGWLGSYSSDSRLFEGYSYYCVDSFCLRVGQGKGNRGGMQRLFN